LAKIFLPFAQVGDRQQRAQGAGLGLAIAQELALAMQGQLTAASVPGEGSQFVFTVDTVICPATGEQAITGTKPSASGRALPPPQRLTARNQPLLTLPTPAHVPAPPPQALAILLDMALKGELPRLRSQVALLAKSEPTYHPFATAVIALIDQYDEARLLALLQEYAQLTPR
jgi:hypothetical protein